jgi:CheY-like chemotaxis protein
VIVSDIAMPGGTASNSSEKCENSPEQGGEIPAVALTASGKEDDRRRALEAGYQVHLVKPTDPQELMSVVSSLATRRPEEAKKTKSMARQ